MRFDDRFEPRQAGDRIGEMEAESTAASLLERGQVAERLCGDERPERLGPARDRQIPGRIGGDLEEDPGVRPALVELPGRVQEARPEPERRGGARRLADPLADGLQPIHHLGIHRQVGEDGDVVEARPREAEELLDRAVDADRRVAEHRRVGAD